MVGASKPSSRLAFCSPVFWLGQPFEPQHQYPALSTPVQSWLQHKRNPLWRHRVRRTTEEAPSWQGRRPTLQGLTFHQLRGYQPGDDWRHIDWNVYARLREPVVRQFLPDEQRDWHLLLDISASMTVAPADALLPLECAYQTVAFWLWSLAHQPSDRAGRVMATLWPGPPSPPLMLPSVQPAGAAELLERLRRQALACIHQPLQEPPASASRVWQTLPASAQQVVVISDFADWPSDRVAALRPLACRRQLVLVPITTGWPRFQRTSRPLAPLAWLSAQPCETPDSPLPPMAWGGGLDRELLPHAVNSLASLGAQVVCAEGVSDRA